MRRKVMTALMAGTLIGLAALAGPPPTSATEDTFYISVDTITVGGSCTDPDVNYNPVNGLEPSLLAVYGNEDFGTGDTIILCDNGVGIDYVFESNTPSQDIASKEITITGESGQEVVLDANGFDPFIFANGTLNIENLVIQDAGTAITMSGTPTLNVTDVTFEDGADVGDMTGQSIDSSGIVSVAGSTFAHNYSSGDGGAIDADGAVTVDASAFTGNESDDLGGAIYSGGELQVTDSQFDSNITENYGGAIYAAAGISVSDSAFEANSATSVDGGAIYADTGEVSVSNTDFSNNEAFNAGGALYIFDADAIAAISDSTFNSNSADYGGAIVSYDSEVAITDSHFEENFTVWESEEMGADFGGAAYYLWLGSLHVEDSTFTRNVAPDTSAGAGIHLYKGSLEVDNSMFTGNQAGQGPAIYSWGSDLGFEEDESVVISDSTFLRNRNTWLDDGGAIAHERNGRDFTLTGSLFRGNVGPRWGGAVETWKVDGETTIENNVFMLNTAREGGALWIDVRNGVEGIRGNQFKKNRARLGGAISFECETVSARSVVRVLTRQNRFSGNVASTRRSSSNAFASQYVQSSDEDCAPTPP
jgi:predicted outer membrane repeat protein